MALASVRHSPPAVWRRPSLLLYLAALALLPWQSFPPFPWLYSNAAWSDVLVAAAAVALVVERRRELQPRGPTAAEAALGLYVAFSVASYLAQPGRHAAANLAATVELAVLAVLTAVYAYETPLRRLIVRVIAATALVVAAAALIGLVLFYAGARTTLVGSYGALVASSGYARVEAGLKSPPLLGTFCIFASAVVAQLDGAVSRRMRWAAQLALAVTVLLTFSRAILGFALAALIRHAHTPRLRMLAAGAAVAGVGLMAVLTFTKVSVNPTRPFATHVSTAQDSVREQELRASVNTLGDHLWLGTGPGSLPGHAIGYGRRQAHNTPVGVGATLGIPALLALMGLLAALWHGRDRPTDRATWSGLAGLGLDGLGEDIEHYRHVWVLLGLAAAGQVGRIGRRG